MIRIFMFLLTIGIIFSESNTRFELKEEINQDLTISFNIKNYELETDGVQGISVSNFFRQLANAWSDVDEIRTHINLFPVADNI